MCAYVRRFGPTCLASQGPLLAHSPPSPPPPPNTHTCTGRVRRQARQRRVVLEGQLALVGEAVDLPQEFDARLQTAAGSRWQQEGGYG